MPAAPVAIIDIGSNSVRLVVYSGPQRVPNPIFNEKLLAGLGKGVGETGRIAADSREAAFQVLKRFKVLLRHMGIARPQVLATAAIRDAANGAEFAAEIAGLGFDVRVVPPEEEARLAGEGVLSAFPDADGIAGDLGGGSLELVELGDGAAGRGVSTRLGVLRVSPDAAGEKTALEVLRAALGESRLGERARGRDLYLVGGSWRALARVDMIATGYPLPETQGYAFAPDRVDELRRMVADADAPWARKISGPRLASLPAAAMLLSLLVAELGPRRLVVSSFGIREGLLYSQLPPAVRAKDPLLEAARDAGGAERRFGQHGDILDAWIAPVFADDPAPARRIRRAACLLADVAWQASSDFRADRGVEMALHGNWMAITAAERVMMAQALSSNFGRDKLPDQRLAELCPAEALERARRWGLAMRLGQRLSAGVGSVLERTALATDGAALQLRLARTEAALFSDPVQRRLERLAQALGARPAVILG